MSSPVKQEMEMDTPLWDAPEQDAEQDALAWIDKVANECLDMADNIADAFNRFPYQWRADMLMDVEDAHRELMLLVGRLQKAGIMETPHAD